MDRGVIASQQSFSLSSIPRTPSIISQRRRCSVVIPSASHQNPLFPSTINPVSIGLLNLPRINFLCKSTADSGENESKTVLDAFFLGKALGEVLNERIESTVGEFLSVIGRLQAEQQKHVSEFQEEVLEKARRAKEQASREAVEAKGVIPNSNSVISAAATSVSKHTKEDPFSKGTK
ncbi:hypothetical protein ACP275_14G221900 [Erythranthe tilingii]